MTEETLSTEVSYSNVSANVADTPTPITTWDVPDGTEITLREGLAAVIDADANGGGDPSRSTRLGLAYREPNDPLDSWTVISDFSIAPFNALSLKDQQSGENAQRRRINFDPERVPGGKITLSEADEIALVVNGDVLDDGTFYFDYPMKKRDV